MARQNSQDNIDELLKIAESDSKPVKFEDTEVEQFIHDVGIERGDKRVQTYIIFYRYYLWKTNKRKLMSRRAFFLQFKKHFTSVQTRDGKGYLLNPSSFDLTPEGFFKARALLRRERNGRQKEKSK